MILILYDIVSSKTRSRVLILGDLIPVICNEHGVK